MKNKLFITIIFLFLIMFSCNVYAASTSYITVTGDGVNLRKGPGTGYDTYAQVNKGEIYYLNANDKIKDEGGCSSGWYHINYNGNSAYICSKFSSYTTINADENCEKSLTDAGFPQDYATPLCALKATHKNWSFIPVITNLDWQTVIEKESYCGKSYIQTSNSDYIDTSCTSAYSSSSSWKPASKTAVSYYMDPRNWLSDQYIFQFNTNKYENSLSETYVALATNTIKSANFYTYHQGLGTNLAEVINQAGKETNVSPIFLSSRMLQELGSGTSEYNLYSGIASGYEGYYNFFNIGVTDSCANTYGVTKCGLDKAKSSGWNSPLEAIKGGSNFVSSSYINVGQYTTYFQKYNVAPTNTSSLYVHQYMTNIAAPASESKTAYNNYKSLDKVDSAFVFYIPVYNNMSSSVTNSSSGAVADNTNTSNKSTSSVSTLVTSVGYKYASNYISGIAVGSNVTDVIGTLVSVAGTGNVSISDASGQNVVSGTIATGYKINITNTSGTTTLAVVIKGDTSGDGQINALDLLQVQKNILGTYSMSGAYLLAADTSGDGQVNALDLLQVQKNILGSYKIEQ